LYGAATLKADDPTAAIPLLAHAVARSRARPFVLFEQACAADPNSAEARFALGRSWQEEGDLKPLLAELGADGE